jgi:hypothetical protein
MVFHIWIAQELSSKNNFFVNTFVLLPAANETDIAVESDRDGIFAFIFYQSCSKWSSFNIKCMLHRLAHHFELVVVYFHHVLLALLWIRFLWMMTWSFIICCIVHHLKNIHSQKAKNLWFNYLAGMCVEIHMSVSAKALNNYCTTSTFYLELINI